MTKMTVRPKPRVLCLHGGDSNSDITYFQTTGLRLYSNFECIYLDAPHIVDRCYPGLDRFSDGPFYVWADPTKPKQQQETEWDASLELIAKFCEENGPFDGVYGFSQGAAIITNFSHTKIWKERFHMTACPWKFAILGCGGASNYITISKETSIDIPSFHIFGAKDGLLPDSKRIAEYWNLSQRLTHTHGRGHEIDSQMGAREIEMINKLGQFFGEHLSSEKADDESSSNVPIPEASQLTSTKICEAVPN
mmetsp:Transcript_40031/g.84067  ORF Transcript_40031/g.84067 Transcript_40031/m.84067 type:complete len:250 (+) Transcript_40031:25-774(+)